MDWQGTGYILSVKKHGETSAIIEVFTKDQGRHLGLVRGGISRKKCPILQPGNYVQVEWRARLSEHLGYFDVECISAHAARLMEQRLSLAGLNALCALARETLPEREAHTRVYDAFEVVMNNLQDPDVWPALFVRWEAGLLNAMGYGLDLSTCAATGTTENLTYVSPRSGRAVSTAAAEPYKDRMLVLPPFLRDVSNISQGDVEAGLRLTGYFLETRVQWGVNKTLPDARERMISTLKQAGYI